MCEYSMGTGNADGTSEEEDGVVCDSQTIVILCCEQAEGIHGNFLNPIHVCRDVYEFGCNAERELYHHALTPNELTLTALSATWPLSSRSATIFSQDSAPRRACSAGVSGLGSAMDRLNSSKLSHPLYPKSCKIAFRISRMGRYPPRSCSP